MSITKQTTGMSEALTAEQLIANNKEADKAGFKPLSFGTTLEVGNYPDGIATGNFKSLTFITKKEKPGRMTFAIVDVTPEGALRPIKVEVPISDDDIEYFKADSPVQFKVVIPEGSIFKRVELVLIDSKVN